MKLIDSPKSRQPKRRLFRAMLAVIALGLIVYVAILGYHLAQIQLGPFAPLALVLALFVLLAVFVPLIVIHYQHFIRISLAGGIRRLGKTVAATGVPRRFRSRYPRFSQFLIQRFRPGNPTGLSLTMWVFLCLLAFEQVVELAIEVTRGSFVPALDRRIDNLVAIMRAPALDRLFYGVTWLGSSEVLVVLILAGVLIFLTLKKYRSASLLLFATVLSSLSVEIIKYIVARPRPPLSDARILETNFSFPSGHATASAAFYGVAAYLFISTLRRESAKVATSIVAVLLVLAVGITRIYLGVHFPSDVLAGWLLGVFWLSCAAIADHIGRARSRPGVVAIAPRSRGTNAAIARLAVAIAAVYVCTFVGFKAAMLPVQLRLTPAAPVVIAPDMVRATVEKKLPHYTEGLTGVRQEPVSLVFVGTKAQLEAAFKAAGWTEAESFSFRAVSKGVNAALTHRSAPAGPVTPSFLAEQPNALAFSLPVGATFAERHHIRIWPTMVQTSEGRPLWLATASFDRGFELAPSTGLPTHQIDPNVDAERSFVLGSLERSNQAQRAEMIQLVPADAGVNFDGDPFHTDGRAAIVSLEL